MLERARKYISENKKEIFFVFLIFLLAFGIRGQLMVYEFMFEFDSYFHARIAEYVAQTLTFPSVDPLAYYQVPGGATLPNNDFFWMFTALLFRIFTLNAPFDKGLWIIAVKIYPALFGALISMAMYYLGKEMYSKKAGLTMAFFAAVVPAFVYRTMTGFFEDDSLGFLWMVIGFVFFARAMKKGDFSRETIINSALAGFFFFVMAWTWQVFIMIPIIIIAWFFGTALLMWFRNEGNEKIISLGKNFLIAFTLFAVLTTAANGPEWIHTMTDYVASYLPVLPKNIERIQTPGGDSSSIYSVSVGEEQRGFEFWGNKYSALIVFPFLALLVFIPYRIIRKKDDYLTQIVMFWILIAMFMAFVRLKFTYVLGLPLAASAGVVVHELFEWLGERQGFEKKTIALAVGFMFLVGVAAGMYFVPTNTPHIELNTGWKESLHWIKDNTPRDAKFFNWWDEGHWIGFVGERAASTDNRNYILKANSDLAKFVLATSEGEAYNIVEEYKADYVILSQDLVGKMGSLGLYAYNTTNYSDPRLTHQSAYMGCSKSTDNLSKQGVYNCGANSIPEEQYMQLPYKRVTEPNQLIDARTRAFVYRTEDGSGLFILNKPANETFISTLFFDTANVKRFELVYSNKEVRIFKVKYS